MECEEFLDEICDKLCDYPPEISFAKNKQQVAADINEVIKPLAENHLIFKKASSPNN